MRKEVHICWTWTKDVPQDGRLDAAALLTWTVAVRLPHRINCKHWPLHTSTFLEWWFAFQKNFLDSPEKLGSGRTTYLSSYGNRYFSFKRRDFWENLEGPFWVPWAPISTSKCSLESAWRELHDPYCAADINFRDVSLYPFVTFIFIFYILANII